MTVPEELGACWWDAMLDGDFERAWAASDAIRVLGVEDPHRFWNGEDITGKRVIVRCLHGFGDSVQFLRYVPRLQERAASVCIEVAPRFVDLARQLRGVDYVITWGDDAPETAPAWDVQIEVMELPYIFRTVQSDLPLATCYLDIPRVQPRVPDRLLQVGLVWTAGEWNRSRGVAFAHLQPLLKVSGCEFWNLTDRPAPCGVGALLHEDERCRHSVVGLAERIAAMDVVITVDTLAAHLAGAMGVPAWVLLQHQADWRWMRDRTDCPWYPSLRLFRQPEAGNWQAVIARVVLALHGRAESREANDRF